MAVVALLTAFALTANAQQEITTMEITLKDAIKLALNDNPTIKVAEKEINLKEIAKTESWQIGRAHV